MSLQDPSTAVWLFDAPLYLFRAYHAIPASIETPDGTPVQGVYGLLNTLNKVLAEHRPSHAAALWDADVKESFRTELDPSYKANRPEPAPELRVQLDLGPEATEAMGLQTLSLPGWEADDLIATFARDAREAGLEVMVVSGDKDLCALVGEGVRVHDVRKDRTFDVADVEERFGVAPEHVPDILALKGDEIDGIPSIPGIGPKRAAALVEGLGGVSAILADPEAILDLDVRGARRIHDLVVESADRVRLSRKLTGLVDDVDVDLGVEDLRFTGPSEEGIRFLREELGFGGLVDRIVENFREG